MYCEYNDDDDDDFDYDAGAGDCDDTGIDMELSVTNHRVGISPTATTTCGATAWTTWTMGRLFVLGLTSTTCTNVRHGDYFVYRCDYDRRRSRRLWRRARRAIVSTPCAYVSEM